MPKRAGAAKPPTELEAAVLGAIWQSGPCTAYAIRKQFQQSPSPKWSGSAGAIYPLLERMEAKKLVRSKAGQRGKRVHREYVLSKTGQSVLNRWLRELTPGVDAALIHDPLRTKVFFLGLLPKAEAARMLSMARKEIQSEMKQLHRDCETLVADEDPFEFLAARNALLITQARLVWLDEAQQTVGKKTK